MTPFLFEIYTFRWSQNHFGAELYSLVFKNRPHAHSVYTLSLSECVKLCVVCLSSEVFFKAKRVN